MDEFLVGDTVYFKPPKEIPDWDRIPPYTQNQYLKYLGVPMVITTSSCDAYGFDGCPLMVKKEALYTKASKINTADLLNLI